MRKAILDVGREVSFRKLREALMTSAGFQVTSVASAGGAERVGRKKYDALVVGAWVPPAERHRVVKLVKEENPQARVVFYYDEKIEGTEAADAILNCRGDHHDLVRVLQHLFRKDGGKGKRRGMKLKAISMVLISMGSAVLNVVEAAT